MFLTLNETFTALRFAHDQQDESAMRAVAHGVISRINRFGRALSPEVEAVEQETIIDELHKYTYLCPEHRGSYYMLQIGNALWYQHVRGMIDECYEPGCRYVFRQISSGYTLESADDLENVVSLSSARACRQKARVLAS